MKKLLTFFVLLFVCYSMKGQEDSLWKPYLHITGYANTIAEYNDIQYWKDKKRDFGCGLSEAAFLVSYKPLKKLEFKGTVVYTHFISTVESFLVEAYGTYTIDAGLKISAGKYLTPLSPVNQYFYAPMNPSATLPMLVSHHFLLPQSISGLQFSGEFGNDFKFGYSLTYGNYMTVGHPAMGIIGLQGYEEYGVVPAERFNYSSEFHLGGCGRIYGNINDVVNIGINYFDGRQSTQAVIDISSKTLTGAPKLLEAKKYSYGFDLQFKYSGLKINAEYWKGEQETTKELVPLNNKYEGYYGEIIYETGIFSPYFRYDYVSDLKSRVYIDYPKTILYNIEFPTKVYAIGIAIRPIYEVLLKMEYRNVNVKTDYLEINIPLPLQQVYPPDNPLQVTIDKYNYFIMSLVYSF